ncbi:DUF2617 family protein [Streptomyces sp. DSM 42041]|uniref:DUF2617 family protein n=1 Tax=Streptomyces hazeniae TaxID=3075538 RepID=A0ABU2NRT1_9ACTN|nr:DUF2617 family protein [Streptomyces sp. DSM 42041]MDT0379692.1 DUF2617 family protein [Streptomyces sp. DSM 42041]
MLTTLKTAYSDTRAGDLAWALGREPLPALATLDLELVDAHVQLRLLGASHQVILEDGRGSCSETVACMPGSTAPLPLGVSRQLGEWDYEFASRVETLSTGSFVGRAQELIALVAEHPHGLAGTYPGSPHAFTALLVQRHEDQVHWRTWHSYPQEGRLVSTRTRVALGVLQAGGTPERRADRNTRGDGRRSSGGAGREGALL